MTKRQKALGVTEYGYKLGCVLDCYMRDYEAFLAKAATIKKGQYRGVDITMKWFGVDEDTAKCYHDEVKKYLRAISINIPDHFVYSDTLGLDYLNVM